MEASSRSVADVLIVTENFIEAADISDAIPAVPTDRIVHIRELHAGGHFWQDPKFAPALSVLSYRRSETSFDAVARLLVERGSALLLLDPSPEVQAQFECAALIRPFTAADLARKIAAIDFSGNGLKIGADPG
ncbi:hypothetical protein [Ruegeria sp. HKCCA4812]|uniref:hypothetical protein n=1 Tax=Ruegeria sp. HKCCA4812 TaxID=2682993 RepID=UPI001488D624|nr:hypothetical protein [Ruegeria sp. HKCCA4812]